MLNTAWVAAGHGQAVDNESPRSGYGGPSEALGSEGGETAATHATERIRTVLDGEIYDRPALQAFLLGHRHALAPGDDAELLAHLYARYGTEFVHAFDATAAFAVLDERRRRLILGRDGRGEKALFYTVERGVLTFASRIDDVLSTAGLALQLDPVAVDEFFTFGAVLPPRSIACGVSQLPAGHVLLWDLDRRAARVERYWTMPDPSQWPSRESAQDLTAEVARLLQGAVGRRTPGKGVLAVLLDGSVASTLLAATAAREAAGRVETFTVGSRDSAGRDPSVAAAKATGFGTSHRHIDLPAALSVLPQLLSRLDEPLATPAVIVTQAIGELVGSEIAVMLSDGADASFAGPVKRVWPSPAERHRQATSRQRRSARAKLYGPTLRPTGERRGAAHDAGARLRDTHGGELLQLGGAAPSRAADAPGSDHPPLEFRRPYLDRELAEFAATVSPAVHSAGGGNQLLRRALASVAPGARPSRGPGAEAPLAQWLRGPLRSMLLRHVSDSLLYEAGRFDGAEARRRAERHLDGTRDESAVLWPLLALGSWLDARRPS
jgi:asparagine synthase (glutamine-hydrolysing)